MVVRTAINKRCSAMSNITNIRDHINYALASLLQKFICTFVFLKQYLVIFINTTLYCTQYRMEIVQYRDHYKYPEKICLNLLSMQIPQIFFLTEKDGDKSCICDIIIFFL